ncbi:MAG: response regulator [Lentimicrobiaceae bacterium]|jgi:CheY-like chemotaxis protein
MKILIAEDNLMNQHLMGRYMSKLGWECVIVENGLLATEACKAGDFSAILMDIDMPVLDGIEATRYIRVFNKSIPIIAITAYADDQMRNECAEAGMNAFLAKPCSREEIKDVISECFQISSYKVAG